MLMSSKMEEVKVKDLQKVLESSSRNRLSILLVAVVSLGAFLIGCQGSLNNVQGQDIQYGERIMLKDGGEQTGQYRTDEFTMDYQYMRSGDSLKISGVVQFSNSMRGLFLTLRTFNLTLLLADSQGKVLGQQILTIASAEKLASPQTFSKTIAIPPRTALLAFSYTGQVSGSGTDGSPSSFWHTPLVK